MNVPKTSLRENRKASTIAAAGLNVTLLLALLCVLPIPAWARTSQQEQSREKLGSLTSLGEVYVNDSPISVMSTVSCCPLSSIDSNRGESHQNAGRFLAAALRPR